MTSGSSSHGKANPGTPAPAPDKPEAEKGGLSNLTVRILSALAIAPFILVVLWTGGWPFTLTVLLAGALAFREWTTISAKDAGNGPLWVGHGGIIAAGLLAGAWLPLQAIGIVVVSAALAFLMGLLPAGSRAVATVEGGTPGGSRKGAFWACGGILYAGLPMVALIALREGGAGLWAVTLVIAVTWATDIFAYFAGRTIGGPKLWPAVSPKKTWSGAIGGVAGGVLAAVILVAVSGTGNLASTAVLAAVLSAISQLGDLFESAVKRRFGVKDSGDLIPGHGGIMDRIDGLVAAAFAAFLVGLLVSGGGDASLALSRL